MSHSSHRSSFVLMSVRLSLHSNMWEEVLEEFRRKMLYTKFNFTNSLPLFGRDSTLWVWDRKASLLSLSPGVAVDPL